jgi:hypothetical protein
MKPITGTILQPSPDRGDHVAELVDGGIGSPSAASSTASSRNSTSCLSALGGVADASSDWASKT